MSSANNSMLEDVAAFQATLKKATTTLERLASWDSVAGDAVPILGQLNNWLQAHDPEALKSEKVRLEELESSNTEHLTKIQELERENRRLREQLAAAHRLGSPPPHQPHELPYLDDLGLDDDSMAMLPSQADLDHPPQDLDAPISDAGTGAGGLITPQTAPKRPRTNPNLDLDLADSPSQARQSKRARTMTAKGTQATQTRPRPSIPAATQASRTQEPDRSAWVPTLYSMFHFQGGWSDALKDTFQAKLKQVCGPRRKGSIWEVVEEIDKNCYGILIKAPPDPRPCLFAELCGSARGPGGADQSWKDCPLCQGQSDQVCCHLKFAPGVDVPFHERDATGKVPRGRGAWQQPPESDLTVSRWLVWLHRKGD